MTLDTLPRGSGTLLVVDDDVAILEVTGRVLEYVGYRVLRAPDGGTAFELLRRNRDEIRLVLLDLTLPGMKSVDVIREIRAVAEETPIVVMTGYPEIELQSRIADQRIEGYIEKPFQPPKLLELLAGVLNSTTLV